MVQQPFNEIQHTTSALASAFDVGELDARYNSLDEIRLLLVDRIIVLLNRNPEKLMSILYRIDVNEQVVNDIFSNAIPPEIPEKLADLVIARQLQKAQHRAKNKE